MRLKLYKGKITDMKYAVIKIKGHQYRVNEGDELLVDKISDKKVQADILLMVDGEKVNVGKPLLATSKVAIKIVKDEEKGKKLDVYKYKAKSRYRKHTGFRPVFSRVVVEKFS